jgi:hypothetical protein
MSLLQEALVVRKNLAVPAADPEWDLLSRYDLLRNKPPSSLQERVLRFARRLLAATGLMPPHVTKYRWLPSLKLVPVAEDARAIVIWAPGVGRDDLRRACEGFSNRFAANSGLVPVLVTDVADFAYFSRLGWLVEYLPELSGEGQSYRDRKMRHLAWRYRDALIVPESAAFASVEEWDVLLRVSGK